MSMDLAEDKSTSVQVMACSPHVTWLLNSLRPRQDRRHFADDVFKCNFVNENVWITITISLKFVPKGPINNIPALVQIMAWRRTGDKPLSEQMRTQFNDAYMRHLASMCLTLFLCGHFEMILAKGSKWLVSCVRSVVKCTWLYGMGYVLWHTT